MGQSIKVINYITAIISDSENIFKSLKAKGNTTYFASQMLLRELISRNYIRSDL